MLDRSAPRLSHDAGAVRIVHDDDGAVAFVRERDDLGQLRQIAFHREHAVGDDDDGETAGNGLEPLFQIAHVAMLVTLAPRFLREPDAVDDRGVVELVGDDRRALTQMVAKSPVLAFQQATYESDASVPRNRAIRSSSVRWISNVPQMKRTEAVPGTVAVEPGLPRPRRLPADRRARVVVARQHDDVAGFFHVNFGRHRSRDVTQRL